MVKISDIISVVKPVSFSGNNQASLLKVVELSVLNDYTDALSWCNEKNISILNNIERGTVICPVLPTDFNKKTTVHYIEVEKPRQVFQQVLKLFFAGEEVPVGISPSAKIDANVKIGDHVRIGHNVVVEAGSTIGNHVTIAHNTVIFKNTNIGNHVSIGANCSIGGAGFGYEKNENGQYEMLPHIGNVVIHDHVEIAHNVCIDRAVLSSTIIKKNAKIDNLVHIAHNVIIGENSLIIANSMIGGSTVIGDNVWVAPSASIINKTKIGDNALVGMGAVVVKPVESNQVVAGNPARKLEK